MSARQRAVPALIGLVAFTLFGLGVDHRFWTDWWVYVGLGTAISSVFVEPFFVRPQDAIVNAVAAWGAWASADRAGDQVLWSCFVAFATSVFVAALVATLTRDDVGRRASQIKSLANQYAIRLGRAVVIGSLALGLEVLRVARMPGDDFVYMALATAALMLALVPNWSRIVRSLGDHPLDRPTVVAALGPRLILLQGTTGVLRVGRGVNIHAGASEARGWVVAVLPYDSGPRYEVALDSDNSDLVSTFPQEVELAPLEGAEVVAGIAGPGTTDVKLAFAPLI